MLQSCPGHLQELPEGPGTSASWPGSPASCVGRGFGSLALPVPVCSLCLSPLSAPSLWSPSHSSGNTLGLAPDLCSGAEPGLSLPVSSLRTCHREGTQRQWQLLGQRGKLES